MNYPPKEWGPYMWNVLHLLTVHPKSSIADYKDFFNSIANILPCTKCKENYTLHLKALPIPNNKTNLAEWLIQIHNRVNISTNKPEQSSTNMLLFWKEKYKSLKSIRETHVIELADYLIHSHPGFYKQTPEYVYVHQLFWKMIHENIITPDIDLLKIDTLTLDIITHKQRYLKWLLKIKKRYMLKNSFQSKQCTAYCMSLLN